MAFPQSGGSGGFRNFQRGYFQVLLNFSQAVSQNPPQKRSQPALECRNCDFQRQKYEVLPVESPTITHYV